MKRRPFTKVDPNATSPGGSVSSVPQVDDGDFTFLTKSKKIPKQVANAADETTPKINNQTNKNVKKTKKKTSKQDSTHSRVRRKSSKASRPPQVLEPIQEESEPDDMEVASDEGSVNLSDQSFEDLKDTQVHTSNLKTASLVEKESLVLPTSTLEQLRNFSPEEIAAIRQMVLPKAMSEPKAISEKIEALIRPVAHIDTAQDDVDSVLTELDPEDDAASLHSLALNVDALNAKKRKNQSLPSTNSKKGRASTPANALVEARSKPVEKESTKSTGKVQSTSKTPKTPTFSIYEDTSARSTQKPPSPPRESAPSTRKSSSKTRKSVSPVEKKAKISSKASTEKEVYTEPKASPRMPDSHSSRSLVLKTTKRNVPSPPESTPMGTPSSPPSSVAVSRGEAPPSRVLSSRHSQVSSAASMSSAISWTGTKAGHVMKQYIFRLRDGTKYKHPPLPPGWEMHISTSRNRPYYTHPYFGTSAVPPIALPERNGGAPYVVREYVEHPELTLFDALGVDPYKTPQDEEYSTEDESEENEDGPKSPTTDDITKEILGHDTHRFEKETPLVTGIEYSHESGSHELFETPSERVAEVPIEVVVAKERKHSSTKSIRTEEKHSGRSTKSGSTHSNSSSQSKYMKVYNGTEDIDTPLVAESWGDDEVAPHGSGTSNFEETPGAAKESLFSPVPNQTQNNMDDFPMNYDDDFDQDSVASPVLVEDTKVAPSSRMVPHVLNDGVSVLGDEDDHSSLRSASSQISRLSNGSVLATYSVTSRISYRLLKDPSALCALQHLQDFPVAKKSSVKKKKKRTKTKSKVVTDDRRKPKISSLIF